MGTGTRIVQVGYGAFGAQHARAWAALGLAARLTICDTAPEARARAAADHPDARIVADWREAGTGDNIDFLCLKRPRRDAGVVLNDAVHFVDLITWIKGCAPDHVQASARDGLGRGFEDLLASILEWEDGTLGRLDASCVVAGEQPDPFAPAGAWSRKRLEFVGDLARVSADFGTGELVLRRARNVPENGSWSPVVGPAQHETYNTQDVSMLLAAAFAGFLASREANAAPSPGIADGVAAAAICAALFRASREGRRVAVAAP